MNHSGIVRPYLDRPDLGKDSQLIRFAASLGGNSRAALLKAQELMRDPNFPYWKPGHPDHNKAVEQYPGLGDRTGLGNDPAVLKFFAQRGERREGILAKINELQTDPAHLDGGHLKHRLYRKAYGG